MQSRHADQSSISDALVVRSWSVKFYYVYSKLVKSEHSQCVYTLWVIRKMANQKNTRPFGLISLGDISSNTMEGLH